MVNIIKIFPKVPTTMIVMMMMMITVIIVIVSLSALSILGAGVLLWDPGASNSHVSSFEILRPRACRAQRVIFPFER